MKRSDVLVLISAIPFLILSGALMAEPADDVDCVQCVNTRDIDFGADGSVWTSNSNAPAWQIETGVPRIIRLNVNGETDMPMVSSNP